MARFQIMHTHLPTLQHKDRRWHRNTAHIQVFHHHEHEVPRRERRRQRGTSAPPFSVSTKDVHGMGITMWMNSQSHTLPQHLTPCPIGRQLNPCNFSKMRFFSRNSHGVKADIPHDQNYFLPAGVQKCTEYRSKFTWESRKKRDERDGMRLWSEVRDVRNVESRCRARPARRALEKPAGYR